MEIVCVTVLKDESDTCNTCKQIRNIVDEQAFH